MRYTTPKRPERWYQVCRFTTDGNLVAIYAPCVDEHRSASMLRTYNATPGRYTLKRRRIDVDKLPAIFNPTDASCDWFGTWEGGVA